MKVVTMKTETRAPDGKSGARRVRRGGRLPAVVYGGSENPAHVSLPTHEFEQAFTRGTRVLDLEGLEGGTTRVLLTDVQYDALGIRLLHADLFRVDPNRPLELNVPVELNGVPKGVGAGGILTVKNLTIRVACLPRHIPEGLEADITELELGATLFAREVSLPENVTLASEEDMPVVSIAIPRGVGKDEEEAEEGAEGEQAEGGDGDDASSEEEGE